MGVIGAKASETDDAELAALMWGADGLGHETRMPTEAGGLLRLANGNEDVIGARASQAHGPGLQVDPGLSRLSPFASAP
jgi:hypothetical protein